MAPGSYSKNFFGISTFQMMYQSNFFFKNHKTELMGVDKIKKYVLTQKISLLAWKIAVLQTFLYHFRTPENPNISKAHIFWLATVMSRTKLILTWFDILLSLEHSGAWPHGAFLISSILRAVIPQSYCVPIQADKANATHKWTLTHDLRKFHSSGD